MRFTSFAYFDVSTSVRHGLFDVKNPYRWNWRFMQMRWPLILILLYICTCIYTGTHSTSGTDMGNPLTTVGPFNHTYLGFTARLNINYQLVDGYMICDPTPNPSYSTGATRMTRIENLVPSDHLFYRDIMDAYGDQIWVTKYSQDIPRMPGLVATKQFFCEKLAVCNFLVPLYYNHAI